MTRASKGPVHNHGTEDGPGLACRETRLPDGALRGACLLGAADRDAIGANKKSTAPVDQASPTNQPYPDPDPRIAALERQVCDLRAERDGLDVRLHAEQDRARCAEARAVAAESAHADALNKLSELERGQRCPQCSATEWNQAGIYRQQAEAAQAALTSIQDIIADLEQGNLHHRLVAVRLRAVVPAAQPMAGE